MNKLMIAVVSLALLSGCSTMKRVTGQIDDTVLPGQRQEVLPPDQQQARDPAVTGQPAPPSTQPPAPQIATAQPGKPMQNGKAAPLAPPSDAEAIAACDPKVDLCPEAVAPEPLPPPSPLIPVKKVEKKIKTAANLKAGAAKVSDANAAALAKSPVKKLIKKKKKPVLPKATDAAAAPAAPAAPDATPPVPAAPQPQSQ